MVRTFTKYIYKLTNKENITHEQLAKMPWNKKM